MRISGGNGAKGAERRMILSAASFRTLYSAGRSICTPSTLPSGLIETVSRRLP